MYTWSGLISLPSKYNIMCITKYGTSPLKHLVRIIIHMYLPTETDFGSKTVTASSIKGIERGHLMLVFGKQQSLDMAI